MDEPKIFHNMREVEKEYFPKSRIDRDSIICPWCDADNGRDMPITRVCLCKKCFQEFEVIIGFVYSTRRKEEPSNEEDR